jgi:hypothetical protein
MNGRKTNVITRAATRHFSDSLDDSCEAAAHIRPQTDDIHARQITVISHQLSVISYQLSFIILVN